MFGMKDSVLAKLAARTNAQRRLLLKNGEVNISRYLINICLLFRENRKEIFIYVHVNERTNERRKNKLNHENKYFPSI